MTSGFLGMSGLFAVTPVAKLVGAFACLFFLLVVFYSIKFMKGAGSLFKYYTCLVVTLVCSLGVIFADNLMLLFVLWGFLGLMLYLLIGSGRKAGTPEAARKALVIVGGTDVLMLFGIVTAWLLRYGSSASLDSLFEMNISSLSIQLNCEAAVAAYLCIAAAALAKAGAMPFHTWVPDCAEEAPVPVTAFLPASLDKLLGVFFLSRVSLEMFVMTPAMNNVLMAIGSVTIVAAVMMALVQHDLKRLLGYHAVSQVGYMVLGIGTGTALGVVGGLFHMFNHTIYKSSLFFAGGVVERRAGTTDLDRLGGLARAMPMVFAAFLIASLSISGVPPFNGFASKWMLYQGVLQAPGGWIRVVWLVAAMFGSALTLASFMKLVHAIFLGQPSQQGEVPALRDRTGLGAGFSLAILSALCVVAGVFAWRLPFGILFKPLVDGNPSFMGMWSSGPVTLVIIGGFAFGFMIYLAGTARKPRITDPFVGGESLQAHPEMRVSGVDFYATVSDLPLLRRIYRAAEKKAFDIYDQGLRLLGWIGGALSALHDGMLGRYVLWFFAGLVFLYAVLIGR
jgi:formate hydrogenlyase subunit 3/multisubunit Na+/H+ antiporter MnhD subunit